MRRLAFVAALLCAGAARAADPRFDWQTIDTPHFEIHFHQGGYRFAAKTARTLEAAFTRLSPLFDHAPGGRTQVVLTDDTDFANGSASPVLYTLVHGFAAPPDPRSTLADFDDWVQELFNHEYTHILHLDTVGGIPSAFNTVFGQIWIPNGLQPGWFIEGLATFAESDVSAAGRVRSSTEEMTVRAEALEGRFPRIDQLSNVPLAWPRAASWYTIGGRFLTFIGDEYGMGALRDLSHDYGSRFIPLALNISSDKVLGASYLSLYPRFVESEIRQAEAVRDRVRAEGETPVEELTHLGELTHSPRFSADSRTLYYFNAGPDRLPEVRAVGLDPCCSHRHVADSFGEGTIALDRSSARERIVVARTEVYQQFESIQDLYAIDLATGATQRITRGARASEPDVAPDGTVAFSQRLPGGGTAISVLSPGGEPRVVFSDPTGEPVASPRWSPSGAEIAFVHHREGSWDVRIVSRGGGGPRDVTHDRAFDRDPSWTPDGRYLLFSSDRTGVYDVYAFRLADGVVLRVTNVVYGAFEPEVSPDGKQLALVTYGWRGYDLARMPFDPETFAPAEEPEQPRTRPPVSAQPAEELYPVRAYSPWKTLRPHFWLPFVATDAIGNIAGAFTAGFDAAFRHEYTAAAWWGIDSRQPGWDLSYTNHTLYPDLNFGAFRNVEVPDVSGPGYTERVLQGTVTATFPFTQVERAHAFALEYELTHYAQNTPAVAGFVPRGGLSAAVLASYVYSDVKRFVRSISPEQGQRFVVTTRVAHPALGSDFNFRQLTSSYASYFALPWKSSEGTSLHHVFASRLSGGIARGDQSERHLFSLGGFDSGDPVRTLLNPVNAPVRILRGYRSGSFFGEAFVLGTFEYRFPMLDVETGAWTLPLYLRRLHGSLFADVGDAWMPFKDGPFLPQNHPFALHAGVGAELRAEVVLGYNLVTDLRFGCAHGVERSPNSILDCYAALGGVF
ncbi:MAG: BamA/TamA family outer membrane protein [Myxococcales bacterium]